jgi:hypothetical protein
VCDLHRRWGEEDPARFAFADVASLPAPSDARTVAALRRCGALRTSPELAAALAARIPLAAGSPPEVALRAAAVAACAAAAAAAAGGAGAWPLQLWHWLSANEPETTDAAADAAAAVAAANEGGGVPPAGVAMHITRDTVFY